MLAYRASDGGSIPSSGVYVIVIRGLASDGNSIAEIAGQHLRPVAYGQCNRRWWVAPILADLLSSRNHIGVWWAPAR